MPNFDPFDDLLETDRRLPFLGKLYSQGFKRSKRDALENMFGEFQNRFLGKLGSQILSGEAPTARFRDFVDELDFDREYKTLSPRQQGRNDNIFAPRVRQLLRF